MFRPRLVSAFLALVAVPVLAGCPKRAEPPATSVGPTPVAARKPLKVGLVTDVGGVNDRSFNAQAWAGLQRVAKEQGAQVKFVESKHNADYGTNLTQFAKAKYDLIFAVGVLMQDALHEVALNYPDIRFAIIDGDAPDLPNCVSYKFKEEEGSFLVGALAASMTKTGTIGFVGGMKLSLIEKFQIGYQAGAYSVNPSVNVLVGYAEKFDDPQKGQELALSQINTGADILYHAAGATGVGVIKAVQNKGKGFYAIGVDKDQDGEAPGRVLTSMVKRVDRAVVEVCAQTAEGLAPRGTVILGLKEDGVALSEMRYTRKDIPKDTLARIDSLRERIIAGSLSVPSTPAELDAFMKNGSGTPSP
jgi:basic membrane protein A